MEDQYYRQLVQRYLDKRCNSEELEAFTHLLAEGTLDQHLLEAMNTAAGLTLADEANAENILNPKKTNFSIWAKIVAAAVVLIFISVSTYLYLQHPSAVITKQQSLKNDLLPGGNKAVLTLGNGTQVNLTAIKNGIIAQQGQMAIRKESQGQVVYQPDPADSSIIRPTTTLYNTINTPKGGQYKVALPDGTMAWLNAASSIRFPTQFNGSERKVAITGEVYFEVVKNKAKPFIVNCADQQVMVLGTHFNINAYPEEGLVKTTLLEGSVKITHGSSVVVLKPGQQSQVANGGQAKGITILTDVDTDEVVAWKNGLFQFNQADIKTLMNQISRWYDVDVEVEGKLPNDHYRGKVSRDVNASKVLKILELSGIHFTIEGRTIKIKP